jgi:hypothetical protein
LRKLIIIVGLLSAMTAYGQEPMEPEWKTKLRDIVTKVAGAQWGEKLFGSEPRPAPEITLPEIPKLVKTNTDIESYNKKTKETTEFDKLPAERKRFYDFEFLKELFAVTRKIEARDEDLSNWLNTLEQGGSREGIYQALVLDEVYVALENMDEKSSDRLKKFALSFSQKFLNQTFKDGSLDQLNLYSIKRIISDKSLDLMEFYETKDLDALYRWYAIFSSDIAKEYEPFLKSEVRKEKSEKYHYEWAKGSPIQHVKSEFIIKLHIVMNGIQLLQ